MINHAVIISELVKLCQEQRVMHYESETHYTPAGLIEKGMWCCSTCGYINSIDNSHCLQCCEERFILISPKL